MQLLEFEEEEENNAPIDIDDDDNYNSTDLFCEEDVMKKITLCLQDVIRNLLPTLSNHADIQLVPTVSRKSTVNYVDVESPVT